MKKYCLSIASIFVTCTLLAQSIGIGTNAPHASSLLDITSNAKGVLFPRMTSTERMAISNPAKGLMVFDIDLSKVMVHNGNAWEQMGSSGDQWQLASSNLFYTNGNVGVGTTAPLYRIHVKGAGAGIVQESANGAVKLGLYTTGNAGYVETLTNSPLHFATNDGLPQLTLLTNGNFGVNTQNPAARLHVSGTAIIEGNTSVNSNLSVASNLTVSGNLYFPGGSPGSGKVLTSDASGNASWQPGIQKIGFSVRGVVSNGADVIAPNIYNKVHFASVSADYGADYQNINGTPSSSFIVPINGFYHLNANVQFEDFAGSQTLSNYYTGLIIRIMARRNGNDITLGTAYTMPYPDETRPESHAIRISVDVPLLANDAVFVDVLHTNKNGSNAQLNIGTGSTNFSGFLIFPN